MRLVTDSTIMMTLAVRLTGYIAPYPMVPIVWTLKQKASKNESGPAFAMPPATSYATAKTAFSAR